MRAYVTGDRELMAQLRAAGRGAAEMGDQAEDDAAEMVALFARRKVPLGPARGGHVRATLRAERDGGAAVVRGGGPGFLYFGWLEFGGHVGIRGSVFREKVKTGRYIYPTLAERRQEIDEQMDHELRQLVRRHGLGV